MKNKKWLTSTSIKMRLLYTIAIHCYHFAIYCASWFNPKAKLWIDGRVNLFKDLKQKCINKNNIIWFHCASLGEFEQGKPLMEKIKQENSDFTILVTFFSPSGYLIKKNDSVADMVSYLPIDTPKNVRKFINIVNPKKVIFIKYEHWYNFMYALNQKNIPFYYISAIFREKQYFFKWYGSWFVSQLKQCSHFFVQDDQSVSLLHKIGISQVHQTGDTRFDRVFQIANKPYVLPFVVQFKKDKKLLVAGSTWEPDEIVLERWFSQFHNSFKLIIAPHEINANHIHSIKENFKSFKVICYSDILDQKIEDFQILIIDTIGMLSKIYKYSDYSYVGGAFGSGLHNILEAAVFGVPLFFGPKYQKFKEARDLVQLQGAFSLSDANELIPLISKFESQDDAYDKTCNICKKYVFQNIGAVDLIFSQIIPS